MDISIAEARDRFTSLVRAAESGENVVITRNGKPVAQLTSVPVQNSKVQLGMMKDRIKLLPGWDQPITLEEMVGDDL